jgi:Flp pilus assembly protein TadD
VLVRLREHVFFALCLAVAAPACVTPGPIDKAASLARQHREQDGIKVLRDHLKEHPEDIAARRMLIRLLAFSADLNGARAAVTELERHLPRGDPLPWIELGHAYELAHRFEEALAAYDTAASVAPTSPDGPREGGLRCARWGEVEEARARLEEAVTRGANDAETWHALGLVRVHLRDFDAAEDAYRRGLVADPRATENLLGLATVAVMKDDAAAALSAYDALAARRPRFGGAQLGRAWALAKLGRTEEARRALDRAEELGAPKENIAKQRAVLASPAQYGNPQAP